MNLDKKYLIIGPLLKDEIPSTDKVFAGDWCSNNNLEKSIETYPYPFDDDKQWLKALEISYKLYPESLKFLTEFLNKSHKTNKNKKYWEAVIGLFLIYFCDIITERLTVIQSIIKKYPGIKAITLQDKYFTYPSNGISFLNNIRKSEIFNWQIATEIWKAMGYEYLDYKNEEEINKYSRSKNKKQSKIKDPKKISKIYFKFLNFFKDPEIATYGSFFSKKANLITFITSMGKIKPVLFPAKQSHNFSYNASIRSFPNNYNHKDIYSKVLNKIIINYLPISALEAWKFYSTEAKKRISKKGIPKIIFSSWGEFRSESFAIWSAECSELDTLLGGYQHGGGYGELKEASVPEMKLLDFFLSWGWSEKNNKKVIPFFGTRLLQWKKFFLFKFINKKNNFLWLGTAESKYSYALAPRPISSQLNNYYKNQLSFAREINNSSLTNLVSFRPCPIEINNEKYTNVIKKLSNHLLIDDHNVNLSESFASKSIILIDYLGSTPFIEALTLGKPCIIFSLNGYHENDITDNAKYFYHLLEEVEIYHPNSKTVIPLLIKIKDDPQSWWGQKKRQTVIKNYLEKFGSTSIFPFGLTKTFSKIIKKPPRSFNKIK